MSEKKDKISLNNLTEENKNSKYIDIFLHLKLNMQNCAMNCKCENNDKYYCIPCKVTCCSLCNLKAHEPHILVSMKDNHLDIKTLNKIFDDFSNNINKSRLISGFKELKQEMDKYVDLFVDEMIQKLNRFRKIKKEEIEIIFKKLNTNRELMNKSIDNIKINLIEYVNRNKKFFNLEQPGINTDDINNDINNTYFLLGYDILSLTNQGINQIYSKIDTMEEDLQNYLDNQEEDFSRIRNEIDKLLKSGETLLITQDKEKNKKVKKNNNKDNSSSSKKTKKDKTENEKQKDEENGSLIIPDLSTPTWHFIYTAEELGQERFEPI